MPKVFTTTWGDIKLATLQKLFASSGTEIVADTSNSEYINAMPQAANEGLQLLSTSGKFLIGTYTYVNRPIEPLYGDMRNYQLAGTEKSFSADGVKAYYFRSQGKIKLTIKVDGEVVETHDFSDTNYTAHRGKLSEKTGKNVEFIFRGDYPSNIKNVALYGIEYEAVEDIQAYEEFIRINMDEAVDDFYQLYPNEIYFEGDDEPHYIAADQYFQEAGRVLVIPRKEVGDYTIYYRRYPKKITLDTPDDYELPVAPEVAAILPLYMASELYKDDDNGIATTYRNEFEVGKEVLSQSAEVPQYEEFTSESGWC